MTRPRVCDVDDLDLELLLAGTIPAAKVHPSVRAAAVRHLAGQGLTAPQISDRLQLSVRGVERWRTKLGLARTREQRARRCDHPDEELVTYDNGRKRCRGCRRDAWHLRGRSS